MAPPGPPTTLREADAMGGEATLVHLRRPFLGYVCRTRRSLSKSKIVLLSDFIPAL
jgi:hypothetical protein